MTFSPEGARRLPVVILLARCGEGRSSLGDRRGEALLARGMAERDDDLLKQQARSKEVSEQSWRR